MDFWILRVVNILSGSTYIFVMNDQDQFSLHGRRRSKYILSIYLPVFQQIVMSYLMDLTEVKGWTDSALCSWEAPFLLRFSSQSSLALRLFPESQNMDWNLFLCLLLHMVVTVLSRTVETTLGPVVGERWIWTFCIGITVYDHTSQW